MDITREIWIGLVGVKPLSAETVLDCAKGGYTNVLLYAEDAADYESKVIDFLLEYDLKVFEIEEVEPLERILLSEDVDDEIYELACWIEKENSPRMTTLHIYDE